MQRKRLRTQLGRLGGLLCALAGGSAALGHGGVVAEEDLCVIEIGVFSAHFTIYQPATRASEEFCEDVPDLGPTVFVMDYLHESLREVPVDFRIIRDVLERTTYANWQDVRSLGDLQPHTVFYQPPVTRADASFTVEHEFTEPGWYTGIVTTRHPVREKTYQAVFGFHVGPRGWGPWPWLVLVLALLQLNYWHSSGALQRWRAARRAAAGDG